MLFTRSGGFLFAVYLKLLSSKLMILIKAALDRLAALGLKLIGSAISNYINPD
jgi:hypothetical protein